MNVRLIHRTGRPWIEAQWEDPVTGLKKTRSTKTRVTREAERFAANLELQLEAGTYAGSKRTKFDDATKKYTEDVFPAQSENTRRRMRDCWSILRKAVNPASVQAVREPQIADVKRYLRDKKRSEETVRTHLRHIGQFLRWCVREKLLAHAPNIELPTRQGEPMRGRAVTGEEFDRMVTAIPAVVKNAIQAAAYVRLLNGLRKSGLRIAEALELHWENQEQLCVELDGELPMFRIQANAQKNRDFQLMPMTDDFHAFLMETPKRKRHGYVFGELGVRTVRPTEQQVIRKISEIGRKANVKVSSKGKAVKYASAHDLRRAFGLEWAMKLEAPLLQLLMRHENIQTTMKYYVGRDGQIAAAEIRRRTGNGFANNHQNQAPEEPAKSSG